MNEVISHPLAERPIEFGRIVDCGIVDYHEFACSHQTLAWLQAGAMTHVDGIAVRLQVMDELVGGHNVIVKAWPEAPLPQVERLRARRREWQRLRVAA